jgi:hypothetical protein
MGSTYVKAGMCQPAAAAAACSRHISPRLTDQVRESAGKSTLQIKDGVFFKKKKKKKKKKREQNRRWTCIHITSPHWPLAHQRMNVTPGMKE